MSARRKLNVAFFNGSLVAAAVVGLRCQSFDDTSLMQMNAAPVWDFCKCRAAYANEKSRRDRTP